MAVTVQSDAGDVANANAYLSVVTFKSYHDDRGNDYSAFNDTKIGQGIIRATDYLDSRFNFRGLKLLATQTTMWPRKSGSEIILPWWDVDFATPFFDLGPSQNNFVVLVDPSGNPITGIPQAVKSATAEYALRALTIPLYQDAPAPPGGRMLEEETVKVDVIEHTVKYAPAQGTGTFQMPAYPIADLMLAKAGLIEVGRVVYR